MSLSDQNMEEMLMEIKSSCSNKTYLTVNSLISSSNRLKKMVNEMKAQQEHACGKNCGERVRNEGEWNSNDQIIM
jgi:cell fate (sporulation/competence/biofilm development) regulator YmcA (YheA/YmcA/DUF963 family)